MRKFLFFCFFVSICFVSNAQNKHRFGIGVGANLANIETASNFETDYKLGPTLDLNYIYCLSDKFRFRTGLNYISYGYSFSFLGTDNVGVVIGKVKSTISNHYLCIPLGISYKIPINDNFCILPNLSIQNLFSLGMTRTQNIAYNIGTADYFTKAPNNKYQIGFDASLVLMYKNFGIGIGYNRILTKTYDYVKDYSFNLKLIYELSL